MSSHCLCWTLYCLTECHNFLTPSLLSFILIVIYVLVLYPLLWLCFLLILYKKIEIYNSCCPGWITARSAWGFFNFGSLISRGCVYKAAVVGGLPFWYSFKSTYRNWNLGFIVDFTKITYDLCFSKSIQHIEDNLNLCLDSSLHLDGFILTTESTEIKSNVIIPSWLKKLCLPNHQREVHVLL